MPAYQVYLDSTYVVYAFFFKMFFRKNLSRSRRTVLGHPFLQRRIPPAWKRLASKLVKLLLLYSTVTCCLVTVEHVLSFWTSCSVKKLYLAHRANPQICGCYLLSMLPVFFYHHYCFCSVSCNTVQQQPFLKNKMFLKIEQLARQKKRYQQNWVCCCLCFLPESLLIQFHT